MPGRGPAGTDRPVGARRGGIVGRRDVRQLVADLNRAGLARNTTALAPRLVEPAGDTDLTAGISAVVPVVPELDRGLLPWPGGLRRGATVAALGSISLVMTLMAGAMQHGAWVAVVGLPTFGVLAAAQDFHIDLARLALVPAPGQDWPTVVSALIDGIDLVVVAAPAPAADRTVRALAARARQRGCVIVPTSGWPGSDLVIEATDRRWTGLGLGHGRLRRQELSLRATGRGRAKQPRTATISLPLRSITGPEPDRRIPPAPTGRDTADRRGLREPFRLSSVSPPAVTWPQPQPRAAARPQPGGLGIAGEHTAGGL